MGERSTAGAALVMHGEHHALILVCTDRRCVGKGEPAGPLGREMAAGAPGEPQKCFAVLFPAK